MPEFPLFLRPKNAPLYVYATSCLSLHLGWTLGLGLLSNAAMNTCVQVSESLLSILLSKPRSGVAES